MDASALFAKIDGIPQSSLYAVFSCLLHVAADFGPLSPTPLSSLVVSHASVNRKSRPCRFSSPVYRSFARDHGRLFRSALVGVEAILELLAVLVARVVGEHLAACGALESLEAGFALDRLRGDVLVSR